MSNPLLCRDSSRTRARAHCSSACDSECFRFCTNNFTTIKVYCEILKNSSETPSNTEFCVLEHSHTGNYTTFWITVNVASVEATKGSENNSFQKIRAKELESCSAIGCFVVVSTWKIEKFSDLSFGGRYLLYPSISIPRLGKPLSSSEHRTYSFWFTFLHETSRTTLFLVFPILCTCSPLLQWIIFWNELFPSTQFDVIQWFGSPHFSDLSRKLKKL